MSSSLVTRTVSDVRRRRSIFTLLYVAQRCFAHAFGAGTVAHALQSRVISDAKPLGSILPFLGVVQTIAALP